VGYGPRYLHSTGQLHKGGPATGHFLILTADDAEDVPIPDERYTFGVLKNAQALGDRQALEAASRPVLHLHLAGEARQAAHALRHAIQAALE
ncbi:MAG: transaldolase, partial [Anaerolineae bacterium]